MITITINKKSNRPLLCEEIRAAYPSLAPVPEPHPYFPNANRPVMFVEGNDVYTKVSVPDTFSDVRGLTELIEAHDPNGLNYQQRRESRELILRSDIKNRLSLTQEEANYLFRRR